jgi:hypothetical protein
MIPTCIRCGKPSGYRKDGRGKAKKYCGDICYHLALNEANGSREDQITRSEHMFRANLLQMARGGSQDARQTLFRLYGMVGIWITKKQRVERNGFV